MSGQKYLVPGIECLILSDEVKQSTFFNTQYQVLIIQLTSLVYGTRS